MRAISLTQADIYKGELILVNAEHPYFENLAKPNLVPAASGNADILLEQNTATHLSQVMEKINGWQQIVPVSGWRSLKEQQDIHTSPLSSFSANADFLLTRVLARTAVPFFLMVTGYFLLPQYLFEKSMDRRPLLRFLKKTVLLYGIAILLYLPVNIYAGHFQGAGIGELIRKVLFDGTFYHLWYLPAVLLGVPLVCWAGSRLPFRILGGSCLLLYLIGLFGDSYYGFIANSPIASFYDVLFHVFSYTRNGLFYVPIFLVMGTKLKVIHWREKKVLLILGASGSLFLMVLEGLFLHKLGVQRHDSMYFLLIPSMFFLFQLALAWDKPSAKTLRTMSMWIYLFHPFWIVAVRGFAKVIHLETILVDNSLIHYLAVCMLSVLSAVVLVRLLPAEKRRDSSPQARAWIELSKQQLYQNVDALSQLLPPGCQLMPAVKANAYGHGAVLIAKALQEKGIRAFCVASVTEGVELRKNGITGTILILGYTHPDSFPLLWKYRLTQTVVDYPYAQSLNACRKKVQVHLKIDTGMHRLGIRSDHIEEISRMFQMDNLLVDGIYTHLCVSDSMTAADREFTYQQANAFYTLLEKLSERGISCPNIHLSASYGLIHYPEFPSNYARIGIALYGMLSSRQDEENCSIPLFPVLSVKARVSSVRDLYKGEGAGYGLRYVAKENRQIAVLSIGYADGIPRSLSNGHGRVLINGQFAPIIGNICMDQMLVDVTDIKEVKQGDIAVLIGKSGDLEITAYDLAEQTESITNEILSRLGARLERILI